MESCYDDSEDTPLPFLLAYSLSLDFPKCLDSGSLVYLPVHLPLMYNVRT